MSTANQKSQSVPGPKQRKTTLKWESDGELSAIDMTRILHGLSKAELTECDLACNLDKDDA